MNKLERQIWEKNWFGYRDFLRWKFQRKLRKVALFIEKHNLYPVNLNKELLEVWKRNDKI